MPVAWYTSSTTRAPTACARSMIGRTSVIAELPLWEGYCENIKSDIADMKNAGGRDGGVITAA